MDLIEERKIHFTWGIARTSRGGWMEVPLKSFLLDSGRGITKAKKLIQYIRESNNPDQENVIREFITDFNVAYENHEKHYGLYMKSLEGKLYSAEVNLRHYREDRDRVKRFLAGRKINPDWKKLNERVVTGTSDVKWLKTKIRYECTAHNKHVRDKAFLDKVSEVLG